MAQYKVPQDVEADDKLVGPFTFRQFVYLLIAGGLIAVAVLLFKLFPLLAIIPLPPVLLLLALALPLKKDQPMETYLAALVSYYLKPRTRTWEPGQRESTITITAPKIVEVSRTRSISGEEATHRLSFLADIVDTGGYAIKGASNNSMREELIAEANATADIFENNRFDNLSATISRDETARHNAVVEEMRAAIAKTENIATAAPSIKRHTDPSTFSIPPTSPQPLPNPTTIPTPTMPATPLNPAKAAAPSIFDSPVVVRPGTPDTPPPTPAKKPAPKPAATQHLVELSQNQDFTVATIAKEANRINRKDNGEVFISLH